MSISKTHCKQFKFDNIKPVKDFKEQMMLTRICSQYPEKHNIFKLQDVIPTNRIERHYVLIFPLILTVHVMNIDLSNTLLKKRITSGIYHGKYLISESHYSSARNR